MCAGLTRPCSILCCLEFFPAQERYRMYGEWEKDNEASPLLLTARQMARVSERERKGGRRRGGGGYMERGVGTEGERGGG